MCAHVLWSRQCCPNYAIRTDIAVFRPSKQHKKSLRQFEAFLAGKRNPPTSKDESRSAAAGTATPQASGDNPDRGPATALRAGVGASAAATGSGTGAGAGAGAGAVTGAGGGTGAPAKASPPNDTAAKRNSVVSKLVAALYEALGVCMERGDLPALDVRSLKVQVSKHAATWGGHRWSVVLRSSQSGIGVTHAGARSSSGGRRLLELQHCLSSVRSGSCDHCWARAWAGGRVARV